MTNFKQTVLILSDMGQGKAGLKLAFEARGFEAINVSLEQFSVSTLPKRAPKAIVINSDQEISSIGKIVARIKALYEGMNLPVLALLKSTLPLNFSAFDSILLYPSHPVQIVLRTAGLIRLAEMEQEIGLRLQTLDKTFGITPPLPSQNEQKRFNILFVGKASPEFMIIINALQNDSVNVVAAFTSFTAFDYLYEQVFDAVVMNGLVSTETAFSVAQTMRKNARLYHVPALLLTDGPQFNQADEAYNAGISDVIDTTASLQDISSRIVEQANFHLMHKTLKTEFSSLGGATCTDVTTQLFNRDFFNAHITRVVNLYESANLPVSLCLIRIRSKGETLSSRQLEIACKHIGGMIKNLVRMHDITARLDKNLLAIAFPGQAPEQLKPVSDRISSILKCAVISDPLSGDSLNLELDITLSVLNQAEDNCKTA